MNTSPGRSRMLCALVVAFAASPAFAQTSADFAQTAAFAAAHQNADGGFSAKPGQKSSLGATNSGVRILLHTGGSVPDVLGCVKFVKSCRDSSGGFASEPGGKPDVITTAIGLMAASELKIADPDTVKAALGYFGTNAKSFEEVRMAIAGLEAVRTPSPDFPRWLEQIEALREPDGSFGKGAAKAYATGGAAAAILRMGLKLENRDAVTSAIKAGQLGPGGWSKDDGPPDLGATYRVMRALYMLREKPDLDRLLSFVSSFRQSDGSYASSTSGPGDLGGTYTATIIIRWARLLSGLPPVVETAGFTPLVEANSLKGWEGDKELWAVRDGVLIGHSPGIQHNEFLATVRSYRDFALSLNFRMIDGKGNSGVQFRSIRVPNREMSGYQADIGEGFWGCLYDESRRNKVLVPASENAKKALNKSDWNHYTVRAMGDQITITLGGPVSVNYTEAEPEPGVARSGLLAVQIHAGGPMEVQFSDVMIQQLPTPTAADPTAPGFHLKTLKTDGGERKYTVYVPPGYDGSKVFPVILFLHGAGERGQDGIIPAQVGLGPAIANAPGGLPAIVVFPQARQTWAADSPDTSAALAALADVMTNYATDPRRVVLTGLSMGGRGSFELAAKHPEKFAAVVPICGPGRPDDASRLKGLPIWTFCGDADRDQTVLNLRTMIEKLKQEGAQTRLTEYRGVGHNSWDRAYNDPELIDWMLAQRK